MSTYRPTVTLAAAMDRDRTTLEVLDVAPDDNGRRPALRTHRYHPSARRDPQRYWELIDAEQLNRWWEPVASPQSPANNRAPGDGFPYDNTAP